MIGPAFYCLTSDSVPRKTVALLEAACWARGVGCVEIRLSDAPGSAGKGGATNGAIARDEHRLRDGDMFYRAAISFRALRYPRSRASAATAACRC